MYTRDGMSFVKGYINREIDRVIKMTIGPSILLAVFIVYWPFLWL